MKGGDLSATEMHKRGSEQVRGEARRTRGKFDVKEDKENRDGWDNQKGSKVVLTLYGCSSKPRSRSAVHCQTLVECESSSV